MEISRDALILLVKAARMADRMAEDMRTLLFDKRARTVPDEIDGLLKDALFDLCGEVLRFDQDFENDSKTVKALRSKVLSDFDVADVFIRMAEDSVTVDPPKFGEITEEMVRKTGGYLASIGYVPPVDETPEGEWR